MNHTSSDVAAALAKVIPGASDRSVRLFSLACLQRVRHLLKVEFRNALETAQLHLNGQASDKQLGEAVRAVKRASGRRRNSDWAVYHAVRYAKGSPQAEVANTARRVAEIARDSVALPEEAYIPQSVAIGSFAILKQEDDERLVELASCDRPPSSEAPPEVVASYEWLKREMESIARIDHSKEQQRAAEKKAGFEKACAAAEAARSAAYSAEITAQLRSIDELFGP